jgi:hypothetical protein
MTTKDDVQIGNFSRPLVEPPPAAAPPKPKAAPLDARYTEVEKKVADEVAKTEEALKPRASYEERLKSAGITATDAAQIVDSILERGYWEEEVVITPRKKARLRTRQAVDSERLNNVIETVRPTFVQTQQELTYKYLLAASISGYDTTTFEFPTSKNSREESDKFFEKRLRWVENLPEPLLRMLYDKLSRFDYKISTVTAEGAIENF